MGMYWNGSTEFADYRVYEDHRNNEISSLDES